MAQEPERGRRPAPSWIHSLGAGLICVASYPLALWVRMGGEVPAEFWEPIYNVSLAGLAGFLVGASLVDLERPGVSAVARAYNATVASLTSVVFALASVYLLQVERLPRLTFAFALLMMSAGLTLWQTLTIRTPTPTATVTAEALTPESLLTKLQAAPFDRPLLVLPGTKEVILACGQLIADGDKLLLHIAPRACLWPAADLKRATDLLVSLIAIVVTLPLWALVALLIRLDSPGPILFRQLRVGQGGRLFHILKFRTMVVGAERDTGPVIAGRSDPRVTRVGRWLRAFRLDELPQLINVLRGDMSLVGPRPERPEFVQQFQQQISGYALRHLVRPGITGLAQVRGRYDTPAVDKLRFDLAYIFLWSPLLELKIILQTIAVMLTGTYAESSSDAPCSPLS